MSTALESRYRRLLQVYPVAYRDERGSELLETLLASAEEEGRRWPSWREAGGLVMGGLRAHAGRDRRLSVGATWLTAVHAAVVMLLAAQAFEAAAPLAARLVFDSGLSGPAEHPMNAAVAIVSMGAAIAALLGRCRIALAVTLVMLAADVATAVRTTGGSPLLGISWHLMPAAVLLVPLARRDPAPLGGLLRYGAVVPLWLTLINAFLFHLVDDPDLIVTQALVIAVVLAVLLSSVVDERLAMAFGIYLLPTLLFTLAAALPFEVLGTDVELAPSFAVAVAIPIALLATSGVLARRRARI